MTTHIRFLLLFAFTICFSSGLTAQEVRQPVSLASPDGRVQVEFRLDRSGRPVFEVGFHNVPLVSGGLGLEFAETGKLSERLKITDIQRTEHDTTYAVPVERLDSPDCGDGSVLFDLQDSSIGGLSGSPPRSLVPDSPQILGRVRRFFGEIYVIGGQTILARPFLLFDNKPALGSESSIFDNLVFVSRQWFVVSCQAETRNWQLATRERQGDYITDICLLNHVSRLLASQTVCKKKFRARCEKSGQKRSFSTRVDDFVT
ncbi:MAG: glycoside hydrolase family 97 N-terminal domain-containing protein [Planctomycetaceae bacterium]|nr:glycoside hydrolase family 97 N-terminal domain-containing protein [Planctomycetaceae bacterium]